jgi:hypothetical protein
MDCDSIIRGFEPRRSPINKKNRIKVRSPFISFLGYLGLEPRTYRLKAEYSTIELVTRFRFFLL